MMSADWVAEARGRSLVDLAVVLGLRVKRNRCEPCPACGAEGSRMDRRPPVLLGRIAWCSRCNMKADQLDLVSLKLSGKPAKEAWSVVRDFFGGAEGSPRPVHRPVVASPLRAPNHIDTVSLRAVLAAARPAPGDPVACAWLDSRGIPRDEAPCGVLDWRRPPVGGWPEWWPQRWACEDRWPLVVPAFDDSGHLRSLHGRAVRPEAPRKTTWPLGKDASGLMFLSPLARRVLGGKASAERVLVVEGLPDYLLAAATLRDPVVGVLSGGWRAAARLPMPDGLPYVVMAHADKAGSRYASELVSLLAGRREVLFPRGNTWRHTAVRASGAAPLQASVRRLPAGA